MNMSKNKLPSIFQFDCPHLYLKEVWAVKKLKQPSYSLRAWSRDLGFVSNTTLSLLINKKRAFTKKQMLKFIKNLKLGMKEVNYFEIMIDYSHQSTPEGKLFYLEKLKSLREIHKIRGRKLDTFDYFSSPVVLLALEMIGLSHFKNDEAWLKTHLDSAIPLKEILSAIELLKRVGLVAENEPGSLQQTEGSLHYEFSSPIDKASLLYHERVLELAKQKIGKEDNLKARYSSYFFNVEKSKIKEAIKALADFNDSFIQRFEAKKGSGESTYQYSVQFIPFV